VKSIDDIKRAVADLFNLSPSEFHGKSTRRSLVIPRQIAIYMSKQLTEASLVEIGRHFGGMHHTTVLHSIAKIEEQRRVDAATDKLIQRLLNSLN
jgi:chromosomal replication initiator protein